MAVLPKPPAPTAPAIAVNPIKLIKVTVETRANSERLSLKYTSKIISLVDAPNASAA